MKEIYLAGGCFWGLQSYLKNLRGVTETQVGYANGRTGSVTYEQVKREGTGHAETVRVVYDENIIGLRCLLELFFEAIDPTALNRQGGDVGTQYRTGIYYIDSADTEIARQALDNLSAGIDGGVVVELLPLRSFCAAEEYHQNYLDKNVGGYCHISPKLIASAREREVFCD